MLHTPRSSDSQKTLGGDYRPSNLRASNTRQFVWQEVWFVQIGALQECMGLISRRLAKDDSGQRRGVSDEPGYHGFPE